MLLHFRRLKIVPAGGGPCEDLVLALERLILGLELLKLFMMGLRQLLHHSLPLSAPPFAHYVVDVCVSFSSSRALKTYHTFFALGTELLRLNNSLWAEDTGPESQNSGDL